MSRIEPIAIAIALALSLAAPIARAEGA